MGLKYNFKENASFYECLLEDITSINVYLSDISHFIIVEDVVYGFGAISFNNDDYFMVWEEKREIGIDDASGRVWYSDLEDFRLLEYEDLLDLHQKIKNLIYF